jgi:hypothetical protein
MTDENLSTDDNGDECEFEGRHWYKKVRAAGLLHEWLWYPHDGELVNGGVFVHPTNKTKIFLLVDGWLAEAPLAVGHR